MATLNFLARAKAVAQVVTLTPGGTIEAGDLFKVTINGKTVSVAAPGTTVAGVCTALQAALAAVDDPEFTEVTWTDSVTHVTGTGVTAGVPFTVTVATTESNGDAADAQTFVLATTTAATGPTFWDNTSNWDTGAIPITGDTANVNLSLGSITDGFAQSAVTLAALNIFSAAPTANTFGRPKINSGGYTEYRTRGLAIGATAWRIDAESPLIVLNFGSVEGAGEVRRTGTNTDQNVPAVLLTGTSGSNTIDVVSGSVGLAYYDGESYSASSLTAGPEALVETGAGATIADTVSSGTINFRGTGTNFQTAGGLATIYGTPGFSVLHAEAGQTFVRFGGTVADVTIGGDGGTLDASQDGTARTFSNCSFDRGGVLIDPEETITFTNGITLEPGLTGLQAAA